MKGKSEVRSPQASPRLLVGVDLGGTNVRAGLVENGELVAVKARPVSARGSLDMVLGEVSEMIETVMRPGVSGIGVGVPGLVELETGTVTSLTNIPAFVSVPLQGILAKRFGVPVFVNNDANCFALGELHFGAGRGYRHLAGLIVGTGLGLGLVVDGKLYSGVNCGAGEIGHIPYKEKTLEHYCSGRFFPREYGIEGGELHDRATKGDTAARQMMAAFGDDFAQVMMTVLYTYDPQIVVLGGSVSLSYPFYEARMRERLKAFFYQKSLAKVVITQSTKPNIAILGAAALCIDSEL